MTTENNENPRPVKKKKHWMLMTLFILILIFGICGGSACYLYQKQQPEDAVTAFLNDVKKMDFQGMASHLQSSDLSALDNADIRNEIYSDFFHEINSKLSFEIKENHMDFQHGTAEVTVLIKYIDGTEIYQEAFQEFLRQIVSATFSDQEVTSATPEDAQKRLASLLIEKADQMKDTFAKTELTYPLIRENKTWKIVALDDETVKIMSANFKNAAEEVQKAVNTPIESTAAPKLEDTPSPAPASDNTAPQKETSEGLSLETAEFSIHYASHKLETDFAGKPCLLVYYDYTNTSTTPSSAMIDVSLQAWQGNTPLTIAIPEKNNHAMNRFFDEVKPGKTIQICQVFALEGNGDVTIEVSSLSDADAATASQILTLN